MPGNGGLLVCFGEIERRLEVGSKEGGEVGSCELVLIKKESPSASLSSIRSSDTFLTQKGSPGWSRGLVISLCVMEMIKKSALVV